MPRFFVSPEQISEDVVTVFGEDAHHISRSLRMAAGERITVCDLCGNDYLCILTDFLPDRVCAKVVSVNRCSTEPPYRATLWQALPKGDKTDSVIQKSVECGVSEIVLFESSRCIAKMQEGDVKKSERRNRIAAEAAKQCGRGILPRVRTVDSFFEAISEATKADLPLFCYESEQNLTLPGALESYRRRTGKIPETVSVVIGSEGGFSAHEVEEAEAAGMICVGLGNRILRTETAGAFVLGCLSYAFEM